jgi:hypothetical protein
MVSLLKLNSCRPWETNIAGAMERGNDREREGGRGQILSYSLHPQIFIALIFCINFDQSFDLK